MQNTEESKSWIEPRNLRLLREVAFYYMYKSSDGEGGKSIAALVAEIHAKGNQIRQGVSEMPSRALYDSVRRFMFFETATPKKTDWYDALFCLLRDWVNAEIERGGEICDSHFVDKMKDRGWLNNTKPASMVRTQAVAPTPVAAEEFGRVAIEHFRSYFNILDHQFGQASKLITGKLHTVGREPAQSDRQGFNVYRYGTVAGNIVRSFAVFTPPSEAFPYFSYRHFNVNQHIQSSRNIRGVCFSLHHSIYCLGKIDDGDGLELLALPDVSMGSTILSGLILTVNDGGRPLVSRIALERIAAKHSSESTPQILTGVDIDGVAPAILERIKNRISFHVPEKCLVDLQTGQGVSVSEMVRLTGLLCANRFEYQGRAFNPAAHEHYPFNQCLLPFQLGQK